MPTIPDVLIVGSGLAGLTAALAATGAGKTVRMVTAGMGTLAISGGSIDLLGAVNGHAVDDPWTAMAALPDSHPYHVLGQEGVREALEAVRSCAERQGLPLKAATKEGQPCNTLYPTIMGTLKPSYLLPALVDADAMLRARHILVASVEGFRDCQPALVIRQLGTYPEWQGRELAPCKLPSPFAADSHRALNALDLARYVERPEGQEWLLQGLQEAINALRARPELILLPPILGLHRHAELARELTEALHCPLMEMACVPPGVGGLRIRGALLRELASRPFILVENAEAVAAECSGNRCTALIVKNVDGESRHEARAFILATGGILGGGLEILPGKARERVFGMEIPLPARVEDLTQPEIFGQHPFSRLGLTVDASMRPRTAEGKPRWENVFFAGRSVGGYDFAIEKCGHGVALSTGWRAGTGAADIAASAGTTKTPVRESVLSGGTA